MQKIKDCIKNSRLIGNSYLYGMKSLYFLLDKLQKKEKKIIFASFSGRQYSDSPKVLFEAIKNDERFKDYELVWAFNDPDKFRSQVDARLVNINRLSFIRELFSSSIWISNASIEKLIPYKSKDIFYLNTWHGIPLKTIGQDEENASPLIKNWHRKVQFDLLTVCSDYDREIFSKVFLNSEKVVKSGLPRNIPLIEGNTKENIAKLKAEFYEKYELAPDKRLVLYTPTFREFTSDKVNHILSGDLIPNESDNSILLMRTHYFEKVTLESEQIINVSEEDLNTVMLISDCLITDYSSVMFDYYLLNKPIYIYGYDFQEYRDIRGFYVDLVEDYNISLLTKKEIKSIYINENMNLSINRALKKWDFLEKLDLNLILDKLVQEEYKK